MDHAEATAANSVERYLLGELSPLESEEFERHFFDCSRCADEVRAGAVFMDNARAVFAENNLRAVEVGPRRQPAWRRWLQPAFAAPAFAALMACVVIFQNAVTIPSLRRQVHESQEVRPLPSFPLLAASRGSAPEIAIPQNAPFYSVYLDITSEVVSDVYVCRLRDSSGGERWSVNVPAPLPGRPLTLLIPASATPRGSYELIVQGTDRTGRPEGIAGEYKFQIVSR